MPIPRPRLLLAASAAGGRLGSGGVP